MPRTPGPWAAIKKTSGWIEASNGQMVAHALEPDDAALIAAAPELLEALKVAVDRIATSEHWWMDEPSKGGIDLASMYAAIAKVEGR